MDCKVAQSDRIREIVIHLDEQIPMMDSNLSASWWCSSGHELDQQLFALSVTSMLSSGSLAGRRIESIMLHRRDQTQAVARAVVNLRLDIMILLHYMAFAKTPKRIRIAVFSVV